MALHIQMSEEAEAEMQKNAKRNKIASALSCLLLLFLGGTILYLVVAYSQVLAPAEFTIHTPVDEDKPPVQRPTTNELSASPSSSSNVAPKVIVSSAASPVNMARVDIAIDSPIGISSDLGIGLGMGGLGDGIGSGGEGLGTGQGGGSALEGTFYDLKQTASGAASGITPGTREKIMEALYNFHASGWNPSSLSKYYQSKQKLYASSFLLPTCKAEYAPIAYECKDKVQPSAWLAVYRGKVRAPKTGKFRFIGTGDDTLMVRFDKKLVLEGGWAIPSMYPTLKGAAHTLGTNKDYQQKLRDGKDENHKGYGGLVQLPGLSNWNGSLGGMTSGATFEVKEGQQYDIDILISEVPGGAFGFALLIEDVSETEKRGTPPAKYQIFRTSFNVPTQAGVTKLLQDAGCYTSMQWPDFDEDSEIWTAVPR